MANDDTQKVLRSLLEAVVGRSAIQPFTQQTLGDLVQNLSTARAASGDLPARPEARGDIGGPGTNGPQSDTNQDQTTSLLARQLADLTRATLSQSDMLAANTQAILQGSTAGSSSGGTSTVATIGKTVLSFLGGGLGLAQLFGKLFGGSSDQTQPVFERYSLPPPVRLEASLTQSPTASFYPMRYSSDGMPRAVPTGSTPQQLTPVTIQVQAMDSRSFMDHSAEIAQAVREALLHSHSLNDVVMEL